MFLWTPDQSAAVLAVLGLDQMKTKLCCGGQSQRWVLWIFFHVPRHWGLPTACQWSNTSLQHNPKCQNTHFLLIHCSFCRVSCHIFNTFNFEQHSYESKQNFHGFILVWFLAVSLAAAAIVSHGRRLTCHTHFKAFCYVAHPVCVWPVLHGTVVSPGLQHEFHTEPKGSKGRVMKVTVIPLETGAKWLEMEDKTKVCDTSYTVLFVLLGLIVAKVSNS